MVDGRKVKCRGISEVELEYRGPVLKLQVIVIGEVVDGIDEVVGVDVIRCLSGFTADGVGVKFGDW